MADHQELMQLPVCDEHGQMVLQPPGTKEQAYCGIWYQCTKCTNSVLFPSPEISSLIARRVAVEA